MMETQRYLAALYGIRLEMSWETPVVQAQAQYFLSLLPLSAEAAAYDTPGLRLRLAPSEKPCAIPKTCTSRSRAYGLTIVEMSQGYAVHDGASLFEINPEAGRARIRLHSSFQRKALQFQSDFFLVGISHLLLARGFFDLHAAGLIRNDVGYLLVGASGSGKSTTAMSLVYRGWRYVSDDAVLLCHGTRGVEACGFRRHLYLDVSVSNHWSHLIHNSVTTLDSSALSIQSKRFVDLEQVYPGRLRSCMSPRLLVFLRLLPVSMSTLSPLDQTSALLRLLRQSASLSFNRQFASKHLHLLSQLIAQTRQYELLAGRDALDDPSRLDELLSGIDPSADSGFCGAKSPIELENCDEL